MKYRSGFTLIELLVVIAIIGTLSTIVLSSLNSARTKALEVKIKADFRSMETQISAKRLETGNTMLQITGSGCTACGFNNAIPMRDSGNAAPLAALISNWAKLGFSNPPLDPWGNPYYFDENEGEGGGCGYDSVTSAGSDGILITPGNYDYSVSHSICA